MIILKGAGRPGQLRPDFFSKMDFHRPPVSQFVSNDKDKILQDVSSLPFYPKTRSVDSLFIIPTFFLLIDFSPKNSTTQKTRFFKKKKNAAGRSIKTNLKFYFLRFIFNFFSVHFGPPEAEIREISPILA